MVLTKFNSSLWESKLQEVENICNSDTLKIKEEYMNKIVRYFSGAMGRIQEEMNKFEMLRGSFRENEQKAFTVNQFESVNGFLSLGSKL